MAVQRCSYVRNEASQGPFPMQPAHRPGKLTHAGVLWGASVGRASARSWLAVSRSRSVLRKGVPSGRFGSSLNIFDH